MLRGITVGCGSFGHIHLEGWQRVTDARIVAVVDKDEQVALAAANRFGAAAYTDVVHAVEEMAPDFIDVVTRPESHLEVVEAVAARGCHVICQKPIASTWDESVKVVKACKREGVRLMICENWRWQPWYRAIKKLVDADAIGQVTTISLVRQDSRALLKQPFPNEPHLLDIDPMLLILSAIHLIDVARFLGGRIEEVTCDIRRLSGATKGEDNVYLHLRQEGEVWSFIYSTRCSEPDVADPVCDFARIEGKKGFIRLEEDGKLTVKPLQRPASQHEYAIPKIGYRGDSARAALPHWVDCLASNKPFETGGEDYLNQAMRAVFAGYDSAETRKSISL